MSDKWKTQPCKDCLIKKICKTTCYGILINSNTILQHIKENQLQGTCLGCGADNHVEFFKRTGTHNIVTWCGECRYSKYDRRYRRRIGN